MVSLGDGGLRTAAPIPISSGATAPMPIAPDATQCCQMVRLGTVEKWNSLNATVPTVPEMAVAKTAAASNPKTWLSRSRVNPEPNKRSIRPAASNASPALHKAKVAAAREGPVSQQICYNRCGSHPDCHWPFRAGANRYQDARGNAGGRPEHRHAVRFCQQRKTKPRRQEKADANRHGHSDRGDPIGESDQ